MRKNRRFISALVLSVCLLCLPGRTFAADDLALIPGSSVIDVTSSMLVVCIRNTSGVTVYSDGSFTLERKVDERWEIIDPGPKSPGEALRVRSGRQRGYRCTFPFLQKGRYRIVKTCFPLNEKGEQGEVTKLAAEFRVASPEETAPVLIADGNANAIYSEDTLLLTVRPSFTGDQMVALAEKYDLTILYHYHRFGIYVLKTRSKCSQDNFKKLIRKLSKETGVKAVNRSAALKVPKP